MYIFLSGLGQVPPIIELSRGVLLLQLYLRKILLNRWAAFIHDLLWIPVAIALSLLLRFNFDVIPKVHIQACAQFMFLAMPIYGGVFWYFGLYRGIWRFASLPDLVRIVKAVFWGFIIVTICVFLFFEQTGIPRTVLCLTPLLVSVFLIAPRFGYRFFKDRYRQFRRKEGKRTLVVGAGHAGDLLLRDLLARQEYQPIAFLDDDPKKHGRELQGIRVYGCISEVQEVIEAFDIQLVLLAIPSAHTLVVNKLIKACADATVEFMTLPSIHEQMSGQVHVGQLRSLTVQDLMEREQVVLDEESIAKYIAQKTVLVTGSGGSIGSELCRQVARLDPSCLILFDNGEYNLYAIDHELRSLFPDLNIVTVLGDVKSGERVDWTFRKFAPHVIFHAAAYKHVPMLEINPAEGVSNNIVGTRLVAEAADRYGAECFVMVSTDKAVNPANVMGCTKRIAEIFCQNLASRSNTRFITTRFGNVLGSTGSVVPLFEKQIRAGGPVTVTHRDITRFFMTIPESVSLILQAGSMGEGGEIFVLDMGEPKLIRELAEQMIRLSGFVPGKDIQIVYTGLRPGEKLFEELFHQSENLCGTSHAKLQLAESRQCSWAWLIQELQDLETAATSRNVAQLLQHLQQIVPEYKGLKKDEKSSGGRSDSEEPFLKVVGRG